MMALDQGEVGELIEWEDWIIERRQKAFFSLRTSRAHATSSKK